MLLLALLGHASSDLTEMATRQAESDSMTSGDVNGQPLT